MTSQNQHHTQALRRGLCPAPQRLSGRKISAPNSPAGGIQQRLTPDPGSWYRLSFQHSPDAWRNFVGQNVDFTVEFTDDDGTTLVSNEIRPHETDGKAHWRKVMLRPFQAHTDTLFLKFKGNNSSSCQAAITNVKVLEVW
ncbi:hypothetical protein [Amycolatopsis orientalis]|uniref:hypothetical protein n=1 Tax=Amycolatopsis orientalis TaxID=31958 RepID=UPI000A8EEEB0|nr:hypothetical protein [Amycolatopsis orientalis]